MSKYYFGDIECDRKIPIAVHVEKEMATKKKSEVFALAMTIADLFSDKCFMADMRMTPADKPDPEDVFVGAFLESMAVSGRGATNHTLAYDKGDGTEVAEIVSILSLGYGEPPYFLDSAVIESPDIRLRWYVEGRFPQDPPFVAVAGLRLTTYWRRS